jgi:hypothetical protein
MAVLWLAALAGPCAARAAQQGAIGPASSGSVAIMASVAPRISVSATTEVALGETDPSGAATADARICVQANSFTGRYDLVASGANDPAGFVLVAADGTTQPLTLSWTDLSAGEQPLVPGVPLQGLEASRTPCTAATASRLSMAAGSGETAAGVITMTVSPL